MKLSQDSKTLQSALSIPSDRLLCGDTISSAIFLTRPAFLCGAVRVLGSEGSGARVRILELSSTSCQFSDPIITSPSEGNFPWHPSIYLSLILVISNLNNSKTGCSVRSVSQKTFIFHDFLSFFKRNIFLHENVFDKI